MKFLKNKTIMITGGTGSFGQACTKFLLQYNAKKIIIYSRDELKQFEMSNSYSETKYPFIRYFLGDVRDQSRLHRAFEEVDYVIHAAALKQVPAAEYNPFEAIKTNIIGAQNIIEASLNSKKVSKVIALSTDKAVSPVNLYGATKLCSDKLFVSANNIVGNKKKLLFSVVRYGNVMGSRGSVIPEFINQKAKNNILKITDKKMTRFNISIKESVQLVVWSLKNAIGGEIFVPKISSYKITDLAKAIAPNSKILITGIRPGEKIHEELISASESNYTVDLKKYYAILSPLLDKTNSDLDKKLLNTYLNNRSVKKVKENFSYNSGSNKDFLSVKDLSRLVKFIMAN